MPKIKINETSELHQIITDFGNPLEIFREAFQNSYDENATKIFCKVYQVKKRSGDELYIDIWDNGNGLSKENVSNFFDLADSTKVDENGMPQIGKLGYKGHGAKIFFNAKKVIITSKRDNEYWSVTLDNPLKQIDENGEIIYSEYLDPKKTELELPNDFKSGFFVRIIGHNHFKTEHTLFMLNHKNIRDYSKWYTVFGTINTLFDNELKEKGIKLFLKGIAFDSFISEYANLSMNPEPIIEKAYNEDFEIIELGHYFPPQRYDDKKMENYVKKISSNKPFWDYYSRMILCEQVICDNDISFKFVLNVEGYETKREYDILLNKAGRHKSPIMHSDIDRYGFWACKGGIPVERIDNWIIGGRGQYSYLQGFVDCDDFKLTANRGTIENTEIEKIDIIRKKVNDVISQRKIKDILNERKEIEEYEKKIQSIEEDEKNLNKRFKDSKKTNMIILPNNVTIKEPIKLKSGYSESETFMLLIQLITLYPKLFTFKLCDYNTNNGIDFVVQVGEHPKYIELKGTLNKKINHPFRHIYKFITYDVDVVNDTIIEDSEFKAKMIINKDDKFESFDENYKGKKYKSYNLIPITASIQSMEVICLKSFIVDILDAKIE